MRHFGRSGAAVRVERTLPGATITETPTFRPSQLLPADAEWSGEVLPLEPVASVSVHTVCDDTIDILLLDRGPAKRSRLPSA